MVKKISFISIALILMVMFLILDLIVFKGKISLNSFAIEKFRVPKIVILSLGTIAATFATYIIHIITKNKVSDIGTIGISAVNFLVFIMAYGLASVQTYIWLRKYIMWILYLLASIGILLIIFLMTLRYKKSMNKIVLIGIVFSLLISAISYLFIAQMPSSKQGHATQISVGLIRDSAQVLTSIPTIIAEVMIALGFILYNIYYWKIKIIYTDELRAISLGLNLLWIRWIKMMIIALCSAAAFMLLGSMAFIGFIAANITYIFFKRLTYYRIFIAFIVALALIYMVYFINFSWFSWNIAISIVSNIIALPYLLLILLSKKQNL